MGGMNAIRRLLRRLGFKTGPIQYRLNAKPVRLGSRLNGA